MDTQTIIKPATLVEAFGTFESASKREKIDFPINDKLVLKRVNPDKSETILNMPFSENVDFESVTLPSKINIETKPLFIPTPFIEANTQEVKLYNLKNDCVIPVFSKES